MKELKNTIKQTLLVTKDEIWIYVFMALLGSVMGIAIPIVVMALQGDVGGTAYFGSLFSLVFAMLVCVVYAMVGIPSNINMALSMGKTRKYLGIAQYLVWMKSVFVIMLIAAVTALIESRLYDSLYTGLNCELDMQSFLWNPVVFILFLVCMPAVFVFMGMISMRMGNKVMYLWWIIGLFCVILSRIINEEQVVIKKLVEKVYELFSITGVVILFCIIGSVLCMVIAQLILRKQRVTY